MQIISIRFKSCFCSEKAKSQHKIKTFLTIGKTPYFYQKNSKNPEKLIVFQGFYSGQHFYPLNMAQRKGFEPLYTFLHNTISNRARSTAPPSLHRQYYILSEQKKQLFLCRFQRFSCAFQICYLEARAPLCCVAAAPAIFA